MFWPTEHVRYDDYGNYYEFVNVWSSPDLPQILASACLTTNAGDCKDWLGGVSSDVEAA